MDTNNIVYSSTADGSLHYIDFEKQACKTVLVEPSKIKYCSLLHSIVVNPLNDSNISIHDIRTSGEPSSLECKSGSAFDISFPFIGVCRGKFIVISDFVQRKEIHVFECLGVHGNITCIQFKRDPARGLILGTSGGQVISHNLVDFRFESNEYFSVFKTMGMCYPVNSVNLVDDTHVIITGHNVCRTLDLKQSRMLFEIKPSMDDIKETCCVGSVNCDRSLFSFGISSNFQKNLESTSPSTRIGLYKIDDLNEISRYGVSGVRFSIPDPENPIVCEYDNTIRREILVSEMSKIPKTKYFDMLRQRRCINIDKSTARLDLPNELVGKIIEYLDTRFFSTISSTNKQFRECLFEKNSITIPTLFDKAFFTTYLPKFKNLRTIILKGEAIRCIQALNCAQLKTLIVVAPSTFLSPTIKLHRFTLKECATLENLIIYNYKKLKITSKSLPKSLTKLHLINCRITGSFTCHDSLTDLDISGSNIDTVPIYLQNSLRKLKLSENEAGENFENFKLLTHFKFSVGNSIPELQLSESIQYLDITGCTIVKTLPRLPNLVHLVADRSDVKIEFENLTSLLHLSMKFMLNPLSLTIKNKTLSSISIFGSTIESFSIECPSLTYLNVGNTNIRDEDLGNFLGKHNTLKYLHTPDCKSIKNPIESLDHILESLCYWNATRSSVEFTGQLPLDKVPNIKITI